MNHSQTHMRSDPMSISLESRTNMYSVLHLDCHVFILKSPLMIYFLTSLSPPSVGKRPRILRLEIEIKRHSKCNRLYTTVTSCGHPNGALAARPAHNLEKSHEHIHMNHAWFWLMLLLLPRNEQSGSFAGKFDCLNHFRFEISALQIGLCEQVEVLSLKERRKAKKLEPTLKTIYNEQRTVVPDMCPSLLCTKPIDIVQS